MLNTTEEQVESPFAKLPDQADLTMPAKQYMHKGCRYTLIFTGVCTHCAHCGMKLTDALSIERGIGPVCSSKGYMEEPVEGDDVQALIDLAEYPELVQYLTEHYKPQGKRGLMNGLVKICSLNRRSPVHQACCDAIQSLGYAKLASTLRESIAVLELKESSDFPGSYEVWVKKSDFKWAWQTDLKKIGGAFFSKRHRAWIVGITKEVSAEGAHEVPACLFVDKPAEDGTRTFPAKVWCHSTVQDQWNSPERKVINKRYLWELMVRHYEGFCAKTPKGTVKIQKKEAAPASQ